MRWKTRNDHEWVDWFAWHPVNVGGTTVWLEKVQRKVDTYDFEGFLLWEYREISD